jgi:hypothetical protein
LQPLLLFSFPPLDPSPPTLLNSNSTQPITEHQQGSTRLKLPHTSNPLDQQLNAQTSRSLASGSAASVQPLPAACTRTSWSRAAARSSAAVPRRLASAQAAPRRSRPAPSCAAPLATPARAALAGPHARSSTRSHAGRLLARPHASAARLLHAQPRRAAQLRTAPPPLVNLTLALYTMMEFAESSVQ